MQSRVARRVLASFSTVTLAFGGSAFVTPGAPGIAGLGPAVAEAQTQNDQFVAQFKDAKIRLNGWSAANPNDFSRVATIGGFDLLGVPTGDLPAGATFTWTSGDQSGTATVRRINDGYHFDLFGSAGSDPKTVTVTPSQPLLLEPSGLSAAQIKASGMAGGPTEVRWVGTVPEKEAQPDPALNADPDTCIVRDEIRGATVYVSRTEGSETVLYTQHYGQTGFTRVGSQAGKYNALALNPKDGYLYAITQDGTATPNLIRVNALDGSYQTIGPISGFEESVTSGAKHHTGRDATGADDAKGGITNGAFTNAGDFIFANNSQSGTGIVYTIPAADLAQIPGKSSFQAQRRDTQFEGNRPTSANDWATVGFEPTPYMWSVTASMEGPRAV